MSLYVFQRLAGTLLDRFRIGRVGPTIRQGTDNPNTSAVDGNDGDIYIRYGETPGMFQMFDNVWREMNAMSLPRVLVATPVYNATNMNEYIGVNRNGTVEIYLPAGMTEKKFVIKDEGGLCSTINTITIFAADGESIDGVHTYVMESARSSLTLVFGSEWHII